MHDLSVLTSGILNDVQNDELGMVERLTRIFIGVTVEAM
jgi:hypothetical protein